MLKKLIKKIKGSPSPKPLSNKITRRSFEKIGQRKVCLDMAKQMIEEIKQREINFYKHLD